MKPIVQCVPNFSEGKDLEKIWKIVEPLKNRTGFKLISYEPDKDYNRTVVTLLGDPNAMIEPLLEFIGKVTELIDMNHQLGEHPRMGATDVVPFIPIDNITMETCKELAHQLGQFIAKKFDIPVFMYAEAATKSNRKLLPDIRKGEYEGMKEKLLDEAWTPDYGPSIPHISAGVTAVGARMPLIAYNIDLKTEDLEIAKSIAKAIRGSSGGFSHVQAGPVYLGERQHVQVTMNILNYKQNPIYRVYETVKMEAKQYHTEVIGSEIIGLVPKDTLMRSLKYYYRSFNVPLEDNLSFNDIVIACRKYMQFRDFDIKKIIEANMESHDES